MSDRGCSRHTYFLYHISFFVCLAGVSGQKDLTGFFISVSLLKWFDVMAVIFPLSLLDASGRLLGA